MAQELDDTKAAAIGHHKVRQKEANNLRHQYRQCIVVFRRLVEELDAPHPSFDVMHDFGAIRAAVQRLEGMQLAVIQAMTQANSYADQAGESKFRICVGGIIRDA
jgi:hypothetical protein